MSELLDSVAEQAYETHLTTFTSIPEENEVTNPMSDRDFMGETIDLISIVKRDYDELMSGRLKPIYPDTLKIRLDCYVVALAKLKAITDHSSEANLKWAEDAPKAKDTKDIIIHEARFIMNERGDLDSVKYLNKIAVGVGRRDLCMDCVELKLFGDRHSDILIEDGMDMTLFQKIGEQYDALSVLLEDINKAPSDVKEAEVTMRKAFTWLYEATSEIRKYGQHIFWRDERLDDYKSDSFQNR